MDIIIAQKDIRKAFERIAGVVPSKPDKPILVNALLTAKDGALHVSATDLILSVKCRVACEVNKPGNIAVNAHDLLERLRIHNPGPIHLRIVGDKLEVKGVGTTRKHTLATVQAAEYPQLPQPDGAQWIEFTARSISRMLGMVAECVDPEPQSKLHCALVEFDGSWARFAGFSNSRSVHTAAKFSSAKPPRVLLPKKSVAELRKLIDSTRTDPESTTMRIGVVGGMNFFECAGVTLGSKAPDIQYAPFEQVLKHANASSTNEATCSRALFIEAIRATSAGLTNKQIVFTFGTNLINLQAKDETSEADEDFAVDYSGPPIKLAAYPEHLLTVLGAIDSDTVSIKFGGDMDPVIIRPATMKDDEQFDGIIAPARL